jgi:hypothetical protein
MRITPDFFVGLCKAGDRHFSVGNALPDDAEIVAAHYDPMMAQWELLVRSETFAEVSPSLMPPILDPVVWHEHYIPPRVVEEPVETGGA